jgi:hypothetical protein
LSEQVFRHGDGGVMAFVVGHDLEEVFRESVMSQIK